MKKKIILTASIIVGVLILFTLSTKLTEPTKTLSWSINNIEVSKNAPTQIDKPQNHPATFIKVQLKYEGKLPELKVPYCSLIPDKTDVRLTNSKPSFMSSNESRIVSLAGAHTKNKGETITYVFRAHPEYFKEKYLEVPKTSNISFEARLTSPGLKDLIVKTNLPTP